MENDQINNNKKPIVIITGSNGLIGKRLVERLKGNFQCIGLDKNTDTYGPINVDRIAVDISDKESVDRALSKIKSNHGSQIASVVHLAAYYDFSGEPSPMYEKVTVEGTKNLLDGLKTFEVTQFIFSSTNLVYKPTVPGVKITEDWPLEPAWDYPASKAQTEELIIRNRGRMPVVILRLAGVYDEFGHSIPITHQIQRIYENKLTGHLYPGHLLHGNAFIHLDDLEDAFVQTIVRRRILEEKVSVFNISEPQTFTYSELQNEIGSLIYAEKWSTYTIPKPLAKVGAWVQDTVGDSFIKPWMIDRTDDHFEMDIEKARHILGWYPRFNLKSTLAEMIINLKANPEAWYMENGLDKK